MDPNTRAFSPYCHNNFMGKQCGRERTIARVSATAELAQKQHLHVKYRMCPVCDMSKG